MAKRKGWSDLSTTYRARLQRGGISKSSYEAGASLKAGRGHGGTPEHPLPANKPVPKQFQRWWNQRYGNPIKMLTSEGERWLVSVSRRQRGLIGSHWNAVHSALWNIPMRKAKWWSESHEQRLAWFGRYRVRGRVFEPGQPLSEPETFTFMVSFDDVVGWTYEDTASFNNIYQMSAA